jgi:hypothetical protein
MSEFLAEHGLSLIAFLFAVHAAAVAIVNMTSTPARYQGLLGQTYRIIEILAGVISEKTKEKADAANGNDGAERHRRDSATGDDPPQEEAGAGEGRRREGKD